MSPPSEPKPDERETLIRIVSAVQTLLEKEGIKGVSLRKAAAGAGISLGTVQYYFPSRAALIEGCLKENSAWMQRSVMESVAQLTSGTAPAGFIEASTRGVFRAARQYRGFVRLRMVTVLEEGEGSTATHKLFNLDLVDRLVDALSGSSDDKTEMRLGIQTVIFAAARYALCSDGELLRLTGAADVDTALKRLEDHIARLARSVAAPTG